MSSRNKIVLLFFVILLSSNVWGKVGFKGTIYSDVYSYQYVNPLNTYSEDHLWLFGGLRSRISGLPFKTSFISHFQYRGNRVDQFSESGDFQLYSAYFQYGDWGTETEFKIGRFFLYRGVGLGTIDGLEYSTNILPQFGASVFGGINSPTHYRPEIAKKNSSIYGGELRFSTTRFKHLQRLTAKLSYSNQYRENEEFRKSLGLQFFGRFNAHWTVLSNTQVRLTSKDIRTSTLRIRYASPKNIWYGDIGIYRPEFSSSSWFRNYKFPRTTEINAPVGVAIFPFSTRIQTIYDHYFIPAKWGLRGEGTAFYSGSEGYRFGFAGLTPYGQIGYHFSTGYLSKTKGPWLLFHHKLYNAVDFYLNVTSVHYEWEEIGIQSENVQSANINVRYSPKWLTPFLLGLEYQYYSNPKLKRDGRFVGSVSYTFSEDQ